MQIGGAPGCTVCGKAVYHAEQVMGPGRKVYHKLCLKCNQCGKRLDPGGLVQHDELPYCSRCHTQLFGTRDLRHGNVLPTTTSPLRTPTRPSASQSSTPMSPPTSTSRPLPRPPHTGDFYTPPPLSPSAPGPIYASPADPNTPITRPNFRDPRPISVPYAGGPAALDERGLLRQGESPRSKVGERVVGEDMCRGCEKRVYAAEQVFAIGHKWHRACLRCSSCRSTVDPSKVSDRDGAVYCKNCYAKQYGPGGIIGKR